jgi:hypothetical protein
MGISYDLTKLIPAYHPCKQILSSLTGDKMYPHATEKQYRFFHTRTIIQVFWAAAPIFKPSVQIISPKTHPFLHTFFSSASPVGLKVAWPPFCMYRDGVLRLHVVKHPFVAIEASCLTTSESVLYRREHFLSCRLCQTAYSGG